MLRRLIFMVFVCSSLVSWSQSTTDLTVTFEGLASDKGKLFVAVYNHEDDFLKTPFKGEIVEIKNGKARVVFTELPKGIYAVSSFHDENDNGKLDTNWVGIPNEPNACSNNAKANLGPPKFKDAKFNLEKSDTSITINYND
ncbi:DUF2141 domain-containing protein [Aureibaculum sp. 2210JD6-5]|uniref:DUF2141 domain-containing protein n=1 Tax=Aureibaculum sp. 2210JD6-5 TaxID=3103957 RepID=UPI002AAE8D84|nr:DUF2141 domain-containing protein [Aureibaculum sp. 2210JD6-5]MDY7395518.1 DUF2141 domain-containing protein [Aureibaculum sp. 2210JD6-5]